MSMRQKYIINTIYGIDRTWPRWTCLTQTRTLSPPWRAANNTCTHKKMVACRRKWDKHISRKVDVAALCGDALAQLYRGYQRIATRALSRARVELIAQIRREVKETISAEKRGPANESGAQRPSDALAPSGHRGNRLQAHNRVVNTTARRDGRLTELRHWRRQGSTSRPKRSHVGYRRRRM